MVPGVSGGLIWGPVSDVDAGVVVDQDAERGACFSSATSVGGEAKKQLFATSVVVDAEKLLLATSVAMDEDAEEGAFAFSAVA